MEVFFNRHLAMNFDIVYRYVEYDHYQDNTTMGTIPLSPTLDGSTVSAQLGLNLYF